MRRATVCDPAFQACEARGGVASLDPHREIAEPRLQGRQAVEHRLHRRILVGVELGEVFGELGERVRGFQGGEARLQGAAGVVD